MEKQRYTAQEAADKLGISRARIYQLIDSHKLVVDNESDRKMIIASSLLTYARERFAEMNEVIDHYEQMGLL